MTSVQQQSWSQQLDGQHLSPGQADEQQQQQQQSEENPSSRDSAPPVRKRTRATADQLTVLEDTFAVNVSPNSKLRKQLAEQLQMSERSIQIWFQNRRAKVKHMQKRAQMQMHQASIRAQLYQYHQQQQQQQQQFGQPLLPMQPYPYYYNNRLAIPARAQSVDAVQFNNNRINPQQPSSQPLFTPASSVPPTTIPTPQAYSATPPPVYYGQQPTTPWPTMTGEDLQLTRQSMPPQVYPYDMGSVEPSSVGLDFPEYLHGQVLSPSPSPLHQQKNTTTMPTLVSVPDAGPTAILATNLTQSNHNSPSPAVAALSSSSPETANLVVSTIDPSNLMIPASNSSSTSVASATEGHHQSQQDTTNSNVTTNNMDKEKEEGEKEVKTQPPPQEDEEPKDLYLSATTLTIGTWHRLKMHETDLVCVYRPDTRTFAWHIVDGGCHFKMEVAQNAVSSIEFVLDEHEALADVHFDISEPPLFYMESTTTNIPLDDNKKKRKPEEESEPELPSPVWVQCSDFTEGKQASRFFRHTLKGVAHHMKQELLALIQNHQETRRLVHFIEPQFMYQPIVESQSHHPPPPQFQQHPHLVSNNNDLLVQNSFMNPMYWQNQSANACELYMN